MSPTDLKVRPEVAEQLGYCFPRVERAVLPSGLTVLWCHLPGKQLLSVRVLLDFAAADDPVGRDGLALVLARSIVEGPTRLSSAEYADALATEGAQIGASLGTAGIEIGLSVGIGRAPAATRLLAEAIMDPALSVETVERVVSQRLAEVRLEQQTPASRAELEFMGALYVPGSRRSRPMGGDEASVTAITRDDLVGRHKALVCASTTTVIIAGDLSTIDPRVLIGDAFAGWNSRGMRRTTEVPRLAERPGVVVTDRAGSVQTQLTIGHSCTRPNDPIWPALTVVNYLLGGGGPTSRVDAVLREEMGVTYGMRSAFSMDPFGGTFSISGSVQTDATASALAALSGVLQRIAADGFTQAERDDAVAYMIGSSALRWETPSAVAQQLSQLIACGLPLSWTNRWLSGVADARVDDLNEAFREHVRATDFVISAVGDAAVFLADLKAQGYGEITVKDAK